MKHLSQLLTGDYITQKRIVVAGATDRDTLLSVKKGCEQGLAHPVLVGDQSLIEAKLRELEWDDRNIKIVDAPGDSAGQAAIDLIRAGEGDILMKGMIKSGTLLKMVLSGERGLRKGGVLSHLALFESPYYHKLLGITDAALNIAPDLETKAEILKNSIEFFHRFGIKKPKVAVIAAVETVNPKMVATIDAALLNVMNQRGQIKGAIIDGPLAFDNIVSRIAAEAKGINSTVAGDADMILAPNIESGNILYKTLNFMGGAKCAGLVLGATVPIVFTSRADDDETKLFSIALAVAVA